MRITRRFPSLFELTIALYSWQALLLYLYNDHLEFANLRSEGRAPSAAAVGIASPQCSPKSMYRLADKVCKCSGTTQTTLCLTSVVAQLGLADLKGEAFKAIEERLSKENIVKELFSDFTWRYVAIVCRFAPNDAGTNRCPQFVIFTARSP